MRSRDASASKNAPVTSILVPKAPPDNLIDEKLPKKYHTALTWHGVVLDGKTTTKQSLYDATQALTNPEIETDRKLRR